MQVQIPSLHTPLRVFCTGAGSDDPDNAEELQTRALKRPRLVWTAQLHQRFVDAVKQLGLKNAVPKTIMQVETFCLHVGVLGDMQMIEKKDTS